MHAQEQLPFQIIYIPLVILFHCCTVICHLILPKINDYFRKLSYLKRTCRKKLERAQRWNFIDQNILMFLDKFFGNIN